MVEGLQPQAQRRPAHQAEQRQRHVGAPEGRGEAQHRLPAEAATRPSHQVRRQQTVQEVEDAGVEAGFVAPRLGYRPVKVAAVEVEALVPATGGDGFSIQLTPVQIERMPAYAWDRDAWRRVAG